MALQDMFSTGIWLAPLLSSADTALVGVDAEGRTAFWSPGAQALFGWTAQEVLGRPPPIVPAALQQEWQLQMQHVLDSGETTSLAETQRLTRDGRSITVVRTSAPVKDASGHVAGLLDVLTDATLLKQLDDESRALAQVRERELIAMDLHDGLIQSLYALVLNLAAREQALGDSDSVAAIHGARAEIERVIAETRSYLFSLRGRAFTPRNLESGLRLLVDSLRLNAGLQVSLHFDPAVEPLLSPEVRGHLLYLIREASSNVLRHADATSVTISLQRMSEAVVITVIDNGRGFRDQPGLGEQHHGLRNMAERARLIGGQLKLSSAPGEGTEVRVELPI
jgi:PAS domain S-box-containing protein